MTQSRCSRAKSTTRSKKAASVTWVVGLCGKLRRSPLGFGHASRTASSRRAKNSPWPSPATIGTERRSPSAITTE